MIKRLGVALVVLAALTASCSSTSGRRVDVNALLSNKGTSGAGSDTTAGGVLGDTTDSTAGGQSSTTGSSSATSTSARTASSLAARRAAATAPIRIGIHVSKDLQAAYTALGASGAEGDVTPHVQQVIAWINANGGMAGHKVEAVFHQSDPLNGSFDAEAEATCADFADDQHVFAVVGGAVLPSSVLPDCLAKKHVPFVWNYHYLVDGQMWKQYMPYLYMPFAVNADRMGFYIDDLAAAGYFEPGARVAIVRYDLAQHERLVDNVLMPRLAAHHVNVVDEVALLRPDSAGAAADVATQSSGAILRMRSERVDHVLFVPTGGAVPFLFMTVAASQGFKPRYAMNTLDIPFFVADQASSAQLHGALAIGWSPPSDVHRAQAPPMNAPTALCYKLTNSPATTRYCDGLFFLKAALDRAGKVDATALRNAVEAMGNSYEPVFAFSTTFGPGRHDGANAARLDVYDDGCGCFKYTGPLIPIG